jgi:membrane protease YdiL (CAAX protease family)
MSEVIGGLPTMKKERVTLLLVAVVLALQHYIGDRHQYYVLNPDGGSFGAMVFWAAGKIAGYLLVPLVVIAVWRGRLGDFGLGLGDTLRHWKIYLGLYLVVMPLVVAASFTPAFLSTYPFYHGPYQLRWELVYAATFLSLEFFFRGFTLFTLDRAIGPAAVYVMVVPYTMIHFGKPLPEVLGAIVAGTVLGHLALKTRSVWGGVAVHVGVAWSMDALALYQKMKRG